MFFQKKVLVGLVVISFLACLAQATLEDSILHDIKNFIKRDKPLDNLYPLISKGEMGGYFTHKNFWQIYDNLHNSFPKFVGKRKTLGLTVQKNKIEYFEIGNQISIFYI